MVSRFQPGRGRCGAWALASLLCTGAWAQDAELDAGVTADAQVDAEVVPEPDARVPDANVPPVNERGLLANYYPNIELRGPSAQQVDPQVVFPYDTAAPVIENPLPDGTPIGPDAFSVRWQGTVAGLYGETYTFYTFSDDGVRLWVNGQLLIDNWTGHGRTRDEGRITLRANQAVPIMLEYYEGGGPGSIELGWLSSTQTEEAIPASALRPVRVFAPGAATTVGLRVADDRAAEGLGDTARFTVHRWGPLGAAISIPLILSGDAEPGLDYVALPAAITLEAHQHARTVEVVPSEDEEYRGSRVLEISLGGGTGFTPGPEASGRFTIDDDERAPAPDRNAVVGEVRYAPAGAAVVVKIDGPMNLRRVVLGDGRFSVGDLVPGTYAISAFADTNGDGERSGDEPVAEVEGEASHQVVLPPDTPLLVVAFEAPPGVGDGGVNGAGGAGGGGGAGGSDADETAAEDSGCSMGGGSVSGAPQSGGLLWWIGLALLAPLGGRRRARRWGRSA